MILPAEHDWPDEEANPIPVSQHANANATQILLISPDVFFFPCMCIPPPKKSLLAVKYKAEPSEPKSCTCSKDTSWDKRSRLELGRGTEGCNVTLSASYAHWSRCHVKSKCQRLKNKPDSTLKRHLARSFPALLLPGLFSPPFPASLSRRPFTCTPLIGFPSFPNPSPSHLLCGDPTWPPRICFRLLCGVVNLPPWTKMTLCCLGRETEREREREADVLAYADVWRKHSFIHSFICSSLRFPCLVFHAQHGEPKSWNEFAICGFRGSVKSFFFINTLDQSSL